MTTATDPAFMSVAELGAAYRSGSLTATVAVQALLERISATEPTLHAWVEVLADRAMEAAAKADSDLAAGIDRGPLHGVPVGIKDIVDVAGVQTRCGSPRRSNVEPAKADAEVVSRLQAAGAIVLGKTVTQEYAAGVVSAPARNPWDPTRIPGGSSGGSAAAVAAGACPIAIGTDTGGSIRIPASVTGTVGLKPTFGLVPCRGIFPLSWSLDTAGPIARSVPDAEAMLATLTGKAVAAREPGPDSLEAVRLGVPRGFFFERLQPAVAKAVEDAILTFRDLGAEVIEVSWAAAAAARAAAIIISRGESSDVHAEGYRQDPAGYGPDLRARLANSDRLAARDFVLAHRARAAVTRSMAALFREQRLDALVTPTLCATAARADRLAVDMPDGEVPVFLAYTMLTMPFNATGQPALSLPCGFDENGLPIGLQLAGRPFQEAALCRIGHAYERAAGWDRHHPSL